MMLRIRKFTLFTAAAWYGAFVVLGLSLIPRDAQAGFVSSSDALTRERGVDLDKIRSVLESKKVAQRLRELGFTSEEVMVRLAGLPDQELHRLAKDLERLQVGGVGGGDILFLIIASLIIALLVVLILELTGHQIIVRERHVIVK